MKFATVVLLGILLLGSCASLNAQPAGSSQVAMAFLGSSVFTSDTTAICMSYYPLIGDLPLQLLFAAPMFGKPVDVVSRIESGGFVVDLEHLDGFVTPPYPQTFDATCIYLVKDGIISA